MKKHMLNLNEEALNILNEQALLQKKSHNDIVADLLAGVKHLASDEILSKYSSLHNGCETPKQEILAHKGRGKYKASRRDTAQLDDVENLLK